jgi:hypothetical protein
MMKTILYLPLLLLLAANSLFAQSNIQQSLSVNADGSAPNASAQLDVSATNKGMLVPRITSAQRTAIASPATGLLVFDTTTGSFWFYNGTTWTNLATPKTLADADGNTKVQVEKNPNEDIIRFDLGGTENMVLLKNTSGTPRLELTGELDNTFIGFNAGVANTTGFGSTATGYQALYSNTTGRFNTAMGHFALRGQTIGEYNTAFGALALYRNTTGNFNTAGGEGALAFNTIGNNNTGIGHQSLGYNETGSNNTAIGYYAMNENTSGDDNTATGFGALEENTTGFDNTAGGIRSLQLNTTGYRNTAYGRSTGSFNNSNIHCTFIGFDADQAVATDFDNSTALGSFSRITASNQVRIGNTNITSIGGYEDWSNLSDGRYKRNISEDVPGLPFILALRPVTYNLDVYGLAAHLQENRIEDADKLYDNTPGRPDAATLKSREAKSQTRRTGFIAQEVERAAQSIGYDFNGVDKPQSEDGLYGLRYAEFVVPLVKAVQEQQVEIERLKKLETENGVLKGLLEAERSANAARFDKITAALAGAGIMLEK